MSKAMKMARLSAIGLTVALTVGRASNTDQVGVLERISSEAANMPAVSHADDAPEGVFAIRRSLRGDSATRLASGDASRFELEPLEPLEEETPVEEKLLAMESESLDTGAEGLDWDDTIALTGIDEEILGAGGGGGGGGLPLSSAATALTETTGTSTGSSSSGSLASTQSYASHGFSGGGGGGGGGSIDDPALQLLLERLAILEAQLAEALARLEELERLLGENGVGPTPIPTPSAMAGGLALLGGALLRRRRR